MKNEFWKLLRIHFITKKSAKMPIYIRSGGEQVIQLEPPINVAAALFNATVLPDFTIPTPPPSSPQYDRGGKEYIM